MQSFDELLKKMEDGIPKQKAMEEKQKQLELEQLKFAEVEKEILENKFPFEVYPAKIQEIIKSTVESLNFPLEFISSAILFAASVAIGNSVWLDFKWKDAAVLYMVFIGNPGTNKTHPIEWALRPIFKRDELLYKQYLQKCTGEFIEEGDEDEPVLKQIIVTDTTIPALNKNLMNNPRGICIWWDEFKGLVINIEKNLEVLLSLWSRAPQRIDRKYAKMVRIGKPFAPIIGTIQTNIFNTLFSAINRRENGFLDRCLLVKPEQTQKPEWSDIEQDINAGDEWEKVVDKILNLELPINAEGDFTPSIIPFDKYARHLAFIYLNSPDHCIQKIDDVIIQRIQSKLEVNFLRICLVLQLLKWASEDGSKDHIEFDTVRKAIRISNYYKRGAYKVWEDLSIKHALDKLTDVQLKIYKELPARFKLALGVSIADQDGNNGMCSRTFSSWIKDEKLFKKVDTGYYRKVYTK